MGSVTLYLNHVELASPLGSIMWQITIFFNHSLYSYNSNWVNAQFLVAFIKVYNFMVCTPRSTDMASLVFICRTLFEAFFVRPANGGGVSGETGLACIFHGWFGGIRGLLTYLFLPRHGRRWAGGMGQSLAHCTHLHVIGTLVFLIGPLVFLKNSVEDHFLVHANRDCGKWSSSFFLFSFIPSLSYGILHLHTSTLILHTLTVVLHFRTVISPA